MWWADPLLFVQCTLQEEAGIGHPSDPGDSGPPPLVPDSQGSLATPSGCNVVQKWPLAGNMETALQVLLPHVIS